MKTFFLTLSFLLVITAIFTGDAQAMNKNDLVAHVASTTGLSPEEAGSAVDAVFNGITETLANGGQVRLVGFGTFSVANRKATTGRNPRTGEAIQIPASNVPKFKAGKALKKAVN